MDFHGNVFLFLSLSGVFVRMRNMRVSVPSKEAVVPQLSSEHCATRVKLRWPRRPGALHSCFFFCEQQI